MASNTWVEANDPWIIFWRQEQKLNPKVTFTEAYSKWVEHLQKTSSFPYFTPVKDPYSDPEMFV